MVTDPTTNHNFRIDWVDPLGWLLFQKLRLNLLGVLVLQYAISLFEVLFFYRRYPNYTLPISHYIWIGIVVPIFWLYYTLALNYIPKLFKMIIEKRIVEANSSKEVPVFFQEIRKSLNSPIWFILSLAGGVITVILNIEFTWEYIQPPYASYIPHRIFVIVWFFLICYIVILTIFRELLCGYWINRLFNHFSINVYPLHPDDAGGLGFIGKHFYRLSLLIIAIGYGLSFVLFIEPLLRGDSIYFEPEIILAWILYIILTPTSFFLPLWSTHLSMKRKRDSILQKISDQFDSRMENTLSSLETKTGIVSGNIKDSKDLQDLHKLVSEQYPVWPFSSKLLRRFSISASLPILLSLGSLIIDAIVKY